MARAKKTEPIVEKVVETETVIVFQAKKALTTQEHQQLSEKIRFEYKKTGIKIVLAPFSTEVKVNE